MNSLGLRQKAVLAVFAVVLLYGFAVVLWFTTCSAAWTKSIRNYNRSVQTYWRERAKIGEKNHWIDAYETEKKAMPTFAADRATDTTWLALVDELARTNNVWISERVPGEETQIGDVYELEVHGHNWEGALESLVKFLYELETTDRGMFDIKTINIKPNAGKKGYLRGSFTVTCAYMRED